MSQINRPNDRAAPCYCCRRRDFVEVSLPSAVASVATFAGLLCLDVLISSQHDIRLFTVPSHVNVFTTPSRPWLALSRLGIEEPPAADRHSLRLDPTIAVATYALPHVAQILEASSQSTRMSRTDARAPRTARLHRISQIHIALPDDLSDLVSFPPACQTTHSIVGSVRHDFQIESFRQPFAFRESDHLRHCNSRMLRMSEPQATTRPVSSNPNSWLLRPEHPHIRNSQRQTTPTHDENTKSFCQSVQDVSLDLKDHFVTASDLDSPVLNHRIDAM